VNESALYALEPWLLPPVIWGGFELQRDFGKSAPREARLGESWEASCVEGRESRIRGGGQSLRSAFEQDRDRFLARRGSPPEGFPLLVKLLSTSAFLSVQVHPNDAQASRLEGRPTGKHEAWVVLSAAPDARVLAGLRPGASVDSLFDAARSGDAARVLESLASHSVRTGDVVEIPPGCVHSPGPGLVLYEVQQPVDLTYRIFDWGRLGLDGKPRALHVDKAREVLDPQARPAIRRRTGNDRAPRASSREELVRTRPFRVERWTARGELSVAIEDLVVATCVAGSGVVRAESSVQRVSKGESFVVPRAAANVLLEGDSLALLAAMPS
jgi:mannose-6-phosphate isomerase